MPKAPLTRSDRVAGALWGLLVGDALGVPYEFTPPTRIPLPKRIEMDPPVDFLRSYMGVAVGTWSDDGAQALCLLDSLLERGELDPMDLMGRFSQWFNKGYMAVDRDVFDIGIQTRQAIGKFDQGVPLLECPNAGERSNGNGSLMRVMPLVLWHHGSDEALVRDALLQSRTTHGHLRSGVCCAIYCLWARAILDSRLDAWAWAQERFRQLFPEETPERVDFETKILPHQTSFNRGNGYVVDTLFSAVEAMGAGDYEAAVKASIRFGYDTDTTACVVGGIAGLRDGLEAIPARWLKRLRGKAMVEPLLAALLKRTS
jgi:ADP-ribosylglycohydrolase